MKCQVRWDKLLNLAIMDNFHFIKPDKKKEKDFLINRQGKYVFFLFNQSGRLKINLNCHRVKVYLFALFIGKNDDDFNLETVQNHQQGNNFSQLLVKGVFFDRSRFVHKGLIKIGKKAQKSHAYQKNQNLIVSENCFVESQPFLEILANDVFCTHGSTTGRLDKGQIDYLRTRGLTEKKAKQLLIEGFIKDLFQKMREKIDKKTVINKIERLEGSIVNQIKYSR